MPLAYSNLSLPDPSLIGMVHLKPLPGAPLYAGSMDEVIALAAADAEALRDGGADAIIVENFGDAPFRATDLAPETLAAMSVAIQAVSAVAPGIPLGVNALRNDALGALGIAVATGAAFIRVNVLTGTMVTDQGLIQGPAAALLRKRAALHAQVAIWADIAVKHAAPLAEQPVEQLVADTVDRGLADALIVSGSGTGQPTDAQWLGRVRRVAGGTPVLVGSGITAENIGQYDADGYIVGTSLKSDGRVDTDKVQRLVAAIR